MVTDTSDYETECQIVALASRVILSPDSHGTYHHILLSRGTGNREIQ
jgi:hypothetical protein